MPTTTETLQATSSNPHVSFGSQLRQALARIRHVDLNTLSHDQAEEGSGIPGLLSQFASSLRDGDKTAEAEALDRVHEKVIDKKAFGGLGLSESAIASPLQQAETLFLVEAWLEAINSRERATNFLSHRSSPAEGTKPMTLAQKIFAQHVVGDKPATGLAVGDVVRVGVDWILASELSWQVSTLFAHSAEALTFDRQWQGHTRN